jgi:site-specific DNA-cytosine methylase
VSEHYYVEDCEDGTLKANGTDGFPRTDRQPLIAWDARNGLERDDETGTLQSHPRPGYSLNASPLVPDEARALTSHADRQDGTVDTYVAGTLKGQRGKGGGGIGPEETLVTAVTPEEAATLTSCGNAASHPNRRKEDDVNLVAYRKAQGAHHPDDDESWVETEEARTLAGGQLALHSGAAGAVVAFESRVARNGRGAPSDVVAPLKAQSGETGKGDGAPLVAFDTLNQAQSPDAATLRDGHGEGVPALAQTGGVRRLTPTECERLQSFPDGWTDLGPDSRRYAALGDAVTVNVAEWLGRRIMEIGVRGD